MTVHVLHAGDGYTYLTRQVASGDHHRRRGQALADYYTAAGNPPGRWVGTGLAAMGVDSQISEAQMKALFGEGLHPHAEARIQEAVSRGVDRQAAVAAVRLGRRFPTIDQSHQVWRDRLNAASGPTVRIYLAIPQQRGTSPATLTRTRRGVSCLGGRGGSDGRGWHRHLSGQTPKILTSHDVQASHVVITMSCGRPAPSSLASVTSTGSGRTHEPGL